MQVYFTFIILRPTFKYRSEIYFNMKRNEIKTAMPNLIGFYHYEIKPISLRNFLLDFSFEILTMFV